MMKPLALFVAALIGLAPAGASAQVVINEVLSNPPGAGNDSRYEFIELYGEPGMNLTGYMIAAIFGGGDSDMNGIPGPLPSSWTLGDELPEIDEAWSLDGLALGANGILVLYNNALGDSPIPSLLPTATTRATFQATNVFVPGGDIAGDLKNNGSQTYILLRKRPLHSLVGGVSVYSAGYAWRKDINPDVNFDSTIDLNGAGVLAGGLPPAPETPVNSEVLGSLPTPPPSSLEPYQMVDDLANSDGQGKEYTRSREQKISDTQGANPDAFTRVAFFASNPGAGWRFDSLGLVVPTRMGDEEFFYGEISTTTPTLNYDPVTSGGPTDPNGVRYNSLGIPDAAGTYLFDDLSRVGLRLTPGDMNDVNASAVGGVNTVQFRFVRGDFDFDGDVDAADESLIVMAAGSGPDDAAPFVSVNGTPDDPSDDVTIAGAWRWQGRELQRLLAMMNMAKTDGPAGVNAIVVTAADVAALRRLLCRADFNSDLVVGVPDIFAFLAAWFAALPTADFNGDLVVTVPDIFSFLSAWFAGCS